MQSLIVARKETAVATFTVIHVGDSSSQGRFLPLYLLVPFLIGISKCFLKNNLSLSEVCEVCTNIIVQSWSNCNIEKAGWAYH
jgi:hypothetical protein